MFVKGCVYVSPVNMNVCINEQFNIGRDVCIKINMFIMNTIIMMQ